MEKAMSTSKRTSKPQQRDYDALLAAIKSCLLENEGIRSVAREYQIDKSSLLRYVRRVRENFEDISLVHDNELMEFIRMSGTRTPSNMVFSPAQEKDLVQYMIKCMNLYYGLSISELRELAYQMAKKLKLEFPPSWDEDLKAGRMWYRIFMRRHPELTLRTPEQTSMNRVKAFCKANVDKFFENLGRLLDKYHFDSTAIFNMDESGFSTVPTKIGKVIAVRGMRRVGKVEAAERGTMATMALAVSASGNSVPPFFLFPRKNMQSSFLDNVSSGTVGFANGSGWMSQQEFVLYIRHFIKNVKPSTDSPVLLLMDNHTSHLSVEALDIAAENGVHILSFPPHCSHRLQPLDVSVFGPTKAYYKSQCSAWQKNNANKVLELRHIAGLVCATLDLALTPKTIKSGFAATGISPFNPDIFTDADFVQVVEQNAEAVAADAYLGEDEQRRIICDQGNIGREEEVVTTEPSQSETSQSGPSTSRSRSFLPVSTTFSSILDEIGPLQATATTKKPSKRGRKAMESSELTSPETIAALKEKATAKKAAAAKKDAAAAKKLALKEPTRKKAKRPAKGSKPKPSPPSDEDADFCTICLKILPTTLTAFNSIKCNSCERPVHLRCANIRASFYTCKHCDSDFDSD